MRKPIFVLLCVLAGHHGTIHAQGPAWERIRMGAGRDAVVAVAVHPTQPTWVFAATARAVYRSLDGGHAWQQRFRVPLSTRVTSLAVDGSEVLLATDHGVYGAVGEAAWSREFLGTGENEPVGTYMAFVPNGRGSALLGTRGGLFLRPAGRQRWRAVPLPPAAREVVHFDFDPRDPDRLYLVSPRGVFVGSLANGRWRQTVNVLDAEEAEVEGSPIAEPDEERDTLHHLSTIAVDPEEPATLYLATSRGLKMSADSGITWHWLSRTGLTSAAISRVLLRKHSPLRIYAATEHGVVRYEPEREHWEPLTSGLAGARVNDLAGTASEILAATSDGLFRYAVPDGAFHASATPTVQELLANFVHEPTVAQVQKAAVAYAEVHPDKIKRWRTQANLKALLPTLSFAVDRDDDLFITSRGSTSNPDTDRFLVMDKPSRNLDVSLKWDLGELLWNKDQTLIDVRSKLMVQLRDQVIDEVTRTYFERRRVQLTLLTDPPTDQQALIEDELRLRELTALIDGMTGGIFSEQVDWNGN